jgi:hypothetical protein
MSNASSAASTAASGFSRPCVDQKVVADVQPFPEAGRFGKEADPASQPRRIARIERLAADADAAVTGTNQAGEHSKRGRLAGAVRAKEREDFTRRQLERDVVDRDAIAEPPRQMLCRQHRGTTEGSKPSTITKYS